MSPSALNLAMAGLIVLVTVGAVWYTKFTDRKNREDVDD